MMKAPHLKGLVLLGGESRRMGQDKGAMQYHGLPQRRYAAQLLQHLGLETWLSCRQDQVSALAGEGFPLLPDRLTGQGPIAALDAAFAKDEAAAWLLLACDLPLMEADSLAFLIAQRDPAQAATAFRAPADGGPEPLVAIWEPVMRNRVAAALASGRRSLRYLMQQAPIRLVEAPDPDALANVNDPDTAARIRRYLAQGPESKGGRR